MAKANIEEELEEVFGKLKVGQVKTGRKKKTRKSPQQNKSSSSKDEDEIHKVKKPIERKSILKESKLRLPKSFISKQTKAINTECEKCMENTAKKEVVNEKPTPIRRSCSTEFRNSEMLMQGYRQENIDDTSPDELAAYMEQILHFPKPMSAMAEMMYG